MPKKLKFAKPNSLHMKKIVLSIGLALTILPVAFAQSGAKKPTTITQATPAPGPELIEKITAKPGELIIPYEKWRLPNGLVVILHEDHSDPIVHIDVTYHVGSARETPGKSGFAHFFEHMMFQGSDHVADEQHFKIISEAGGNMNGNTSFDRTKYFEIVPKNYLETMLWLEADRMGFLLDAVTQKKFEVQRATVKNEKSQNYDNRPYGRLFEAKAQTLYPPNHPYSWIPIGYVEDLNRVNVDDLKNFFMRWCGPNNASIVVAGDMNPEQTLKMIEKYFGSIPRGPEVRKQRVDPVRLPDNVYKTFQDKVYFPLTQFHYPTVPITSPDNPALNVLASVLGQGSNSMLYKHFVKSEKAIEASANVLDLELAGEFSITIVPYPFSETDVEVELKKCFEEFESMGVSDEELVRAKAGFETYFANRMESISDKAEDLADWHYLFPNKSINTKDMIEAINKVKKEDVMRVYNQYIKGKYSAIINVVPKPFNPNEKKEEEKKEEEITTSGKVTSELEYKGLSYTKPVDNFDRSKRPSITESVAPIVPKFYSKTMANGLKMAGSTSNEVPIINLFLTIKGGNNVVGSEIGKSGLANLTAEMMQKSTQNYTSEQFEAEMDKLGASIRFNASKNDISMVVTTPKKNLDAVLKLTEEKLLRPKFTAEEFKLVQKQIAEGINSEGVDPGALANKAYARLLYGKSIAAEPVNGTIKTLKTMTVKDVQSFYDKYFSPSVSNLLIVGDVTENEIIPKLDFLNKWTKKDVELPVIAAAKLPEKQQIYVVDKYKAPQSEIRIGYVALPYDYKDKYFKASVMNFPLGGNFNSRLNLNLREEKGWTYGIRSGFQGGRNPGPFTISTSVKTAATDSALAEIFKEMNNFNQKGITDEELAYAKKSFTQSDALRYETQYDKARFLGEIVSYDLPADFISQQNSVLQSLSKEEINGLTKELLPVDKMIIVVVGDKDKIQAGLEKVNLYYEPGFKSPVGGVKVVDYKVE
jgi:zinc protease